MPQKGKFGRFCEGSSISENKEVTPTKIGVHMHVDINFILA